MSANDLGLHAAFHQFSVQGLRTVLEYSCIGFNGMCVAIVSNPRAHQPTALLIIAFAASVIERATAFTPNACRAR